MQLKALPDAGERPALSGFTIRALRGESEPDLDLVAEAPDGSLAAFCIGWLNRNTSLGISGQIEPVGVHENYRNIGLGRTILMEGLRRLQLQGASQIYVETDNYRGAALELYKAAGFRVIKDVLVFRRNYVET
jgi:mycothiol synthase